MIKRMPLYLAIDTSSDEMSVALVSSIGNMVFRTLSQTRGQGEVLFSLIQQTFKELNKTPKDLTHIVVTVGPGSFTGVRIGLATARD